MAPQQRGHMAPNFITNLRLVERTGLVNKLQNLMSRGKAHLPQDEREADGSILSPASGEVLLSQVPQTSKCCTVKGIKQLSQ